VWGLLDDTLPLNGFVSSNLPMGTPRLLKARIKRGDVAHVPEGRWAGEHVDILKPFRGVWVGYAAESRGGLVT
jgi:hypothetical protein